MNVRVDAGQTKENVTKPQEDIRFSAAGNQQKKADIRGKTMQEGMYGFQVLPGQSFGNNAYQEGAGKGVPTEGASSPALSDVQMQKNYRLLMSATVSDEEFGKLMKEGYRPGEMTPEEIVTVVDEIKAKMAEAGVVVAGYNDDLKASKLEEITGSKANARVVLDVLKQADSLQEKDRDRNGDAIRPAMKAYDLPGTKENMQQMRQAVAMAEEFQQLTEGSMKYLLENWLEPTFENIYLASHSGAVLPKNQAMGYFSQGLGYFGKKPEEVNLEELKAQIDKVIQDAGYAVTDENRKGAGWMIENGLTLTEESFARYQQLSQMEFPMTEKDAAFAAACALKNGKKAIEAVPGETMTYEQQAKELVQQVNNISPAAIEKAVNEGVVICIRSLSRAQQEIQMNSRWMRTGALTNAGLQSGNAGIGALSGEGMQMKSADVGAVPFAGLQNRDAGTEMLPTEGMQSKTMPGGNPISDTMKQPGQTAGNPASQKLLMVRSTVEEIRLQMTVASAARLLRNGISVDTTELSQLVEDLKLQQQKRNEVLFGTGSVEENAGKEKLWSETKDIVNQLPDMPAALVGKISMRSSYTLNIAFEQGSILRTAYEAAGDSYEALMTSPLPGNDNSGASRDAINISARVNYAAAEASYEALWTSPRADLGDSITKAFRNVDDLLLENGMEVTPENEKAVRILGYNHMEINAASIERVREASLQLTGVISRLTPAATLDLIRADYNPLEMNLEQLERFLNERDSDPLKELEKYSNFLVRMQENKEMTKEEQESYIGIYRMLHQIEKRDGAALGAVLNRGGEITFRNLLSSVQSFRQQGKEFVMDDSFGLLDQVVTKGVSVTEQIASAFTGQTKKPEQSTDVISDISSDALRLLENTGVRITLDEMSAANRLVTDRGGFYRKAATRLEEAKGNSAAANAGKAVPAGNTLEIPNASGDSAKESLSDIFSDFDEISEKMQSALTDKDSAVNAFREMSAGLQRALERSIGQVDNPLDMREITLAMKQISFAGKMAERESYEIPMRLGNEITSVNVHLVRNRQKNPFVSIYTDSERFGKLQATFRQTGEAITGYITADQKTVLKELENKFASFKEKLTENNIELETVNFVHSESFRVNYLTETADVNNKEFMKGKDLFLRPRDLSNQDKNAESDSKSTAAEKENADLQERISTQKLYDIAREFLSIL